MMRRPLRLWIARIQRGDARACASLERLHAMIGGIAGALCGLAIAMILVRPLLALIPGSDGVWR